MLKPTSQAGGITDLYVFGTGSSSCFIILLAKLRIQECEQWELFSFIPELNNFTENYIYKKTL